MPIVHIHIASGRASAEKKAILDGVHAALVAAFKIPEHDRHQLLHEHDPANFESSHGREFTLVEVTAFPGRSAEAKEKLYAGVVDNLRAAPGIDPAKVLIVIHEPPLESWGIKGGHPASQVNVGFKLDV